MALAVGGYISTLTVPDSTICSPSTGRRCQAARSEGCYRTVFRYGPDERVFLAKAVNS